MRRADLVVVNRYELEALTATPRLVALTLGAEGAVLLEDRRGGRAGGGASGGGGRRDGAGDAFTACLVVSLLEGRPREDGAGPGLQGGSAGGVAGRCAVVATDGGGG